jgi:predicted transcriptional regulator of viral defense system
MIKRLVKERVLHKVQRGFYVTKKPDLIILACRLKKNAYISMDSALAIHGIIGAVPEQGVSAVVPGIRRQMLETPWGNIRFFSIKRELIFGVCSMTNGARMADNEKAYLDMLYFYSRGVRFVIDPLNEVNLRKLDRKKLNRYLGRYRNSRFVKFARGLLE